MVLVELTAGWSLLSIWMTISALAWFFIMTTSSVAFYMYFWKPTFELWQRKSSPHYVPATKVREEIVQMNKGLIFSAFAPSLTIWLAQRGMTKAYSSTPDSWAQEFACQFLYWLLLDVYEFLYHYGTHRIAVLWTFHKYHHTFPNPTPFAVIADEIVDQVIRSAPMVLFPLFLPLNVDLLFFQMACIHYAYGTYLHCGHELAVLDAHHPFMNTSYHHYCHHAVSIIHKPYHCGFVLSVSFFYVEVSSTCYCVLNVRKL
eukprot:GHVQ01004790.1.p1 GENE.GHVQ01004790.1~~GHVQ01004790.1.p1  ORF type:complete len:258 (+),score=6.64 GHVQ01004790.1:318-1091(+)